MFVVQYQWRRAGSVYYMLDGSPLGIAENNVAAIIPPSRSRGWRGRVQGGDTEYAGFISERRRGRDQPGEQVGRRPVPRDAFVVLRPNVMAANDYFNKGSQLSQGQPNQSPNFHRYQEGGSISGPILHKKLFFYGDYEARSSNSSMV